LNSSESTEFSPAYVAVLHDLVTAYHDKLSEVLSPAEVEKFRVATADRILSNLDLKSAGQAQVMQTVAKLLSDWGLTLKVEEELGQLRCSIDCPYAHTVHPLYATPTFCPISTLVLGAVRSKEPKARLASIQLTDEGTEFRIEP
jgi:hypothetical protein